MNNLLHNRKFSPVYLFGIVCLLILPAATHASFSLSGSVITQSGTDNDLSGLANISGVTATDNENHKTYDLGSKQLVVNGTLTISPESEMITTDFTNKAIRINSGAELIIDGKITQNGETTYSTAYWLVGSSFTDTPQGMYDDDYSLIYVNNGAELNWEGGYIKGRQPLEFRRSSSSNQSKVKIVNGGADFLQALSGYPVMVRAKSSDLYVDGFHFVNGGSWVIFRPVDTGNLFQGFTFEHANGIGAFSGGSQSSVWHEVRNYDSFNPVDDVSFWKGKWNRFINPENGSDLIIRGYSGDGTEDHYNYGLIEIRKEIEIQVNDEAGDPIDGASYLIPDTNNGKRINHSSHTYTNDFDYSGETNSAGEGEVDLLIAAAVRNDDGAQGDNDSGLNAKDYRGKNGDTSDVFDVKIWDYNYLGETREVAMKGTGVLEVDFTLSIDELITESDPAIVSAYTELETPQKFYDYAKLWLIEEYAEQTDTLVSLEGDTIVSDFNLTLDPNAAAVFAFDGSTITARASQFMGNIEASTITTLNNARVLGLRNGVFYAQDGDIIDTEYTKVVADQNMSIVVDGVTLPEVEVINGAILNISGINNAKQPTIITETSGTIIIDGDLIPSSNYVETAGVLTMSGTETDLTGMRGLSGVSHSTFAGITTYDIGDVLLQINGELTINSNEKIVYGENAPEVYLVIGSSGHLTIYGTNDGNTSTENIANPQIINEQQSPDHFQTSHGILVNGMLELQGGMIDIASHINFQANSVFRARAGVVKMSDAANVFPNLLRFANASGGTIDIDDFVLYQGSNAFELRDINVTTLENYSPRNCKEGIMKQGTTANPLELINFNPENCDIDTSYIGSGSFYLIYGMPDKAPTATVHFDHSSASGGGITEVRKNVLFTLTESETGQEISDVIIYTKDSVHSTTRDYSNAFYVSLVSGNQILTQHEYVATTDNSGQASIDKLLAYAGVFGGEYVGQDSAAREVLYKTKASDHNYVDDFAIASYAHQLTTISDVDLTGLGEKEIAWALFVDDAINQNDSTIVSAYTELETSEKLYDYAKYYLVENYAGETATIVNRLSDTVDAGVYDVVIDATAPEVFDFDGSTITVRASEFVGNLSTTGTITLLNGAIVDGGIGDADGDSSVTTVDVPSTASTVVYDTDGTTILATTTGDIFYQYTANPTEAIFIEFIDTNGTKLRRSFTKDSGFFTLDMNYSVSDFSGQDRLHLTNNNTAIIQVWDRVSLWPEKLASYFDLIPFMR